MKKFAIAKRLALMLLLVCCSKEDISNQIQEKKTLVEKSTPFNLVDFYTPPSSKRKQKDNTAEISRALEHLRNNKSSVFSDSDFTFEPKSVVVDKSGNEKVLFNTRFRNVRVLGGDVIVHSAPDGKLKNIEKKLDRRIQVDLASTLPPDKASEAAQKVFKGKLLKGEEPELIIYALDGEPKAAYEVVLKGFLRETHPSEQHVFVDALSGVTLQQWDKICEGIQIPDGTAQTDAASGATPTSEGSYVNLNTAFVDTSMTFKLHSNPTASKVIYLDFTGHTTQNTSWNSNYYAGADIVSPPFDLDGDSSTFSADEKQKIQQIWQFISVDFAPFDVNVTTEEPPPDDLIKQGITDTKYGIRVVFSSVGPDSGNTGVGGIAYSDSFDLNSDTPAFVYAHKFYGVTKNMAEAASHEIGHSLGLSHDGNSQGTYYEGHGFGEVGWASIMGVGYFRNVSTWDKGEYFGYVGELSTLSTNPNYGKGPDDIAAITNYNGFGYIHDNEANNISTAGVLFYNASAQKRVSQLGVINSNIDSDFFRLDIASNGSIDLTFDPYISLAWINTGGTFDGTKQSYFSFVPDINPWTVTQGAQTPWAEGGSNLDIKVSLLNSNGDILAVASNVGRLIPTSNTDNTRFLPERLTLSGLSAGSYFLKVEGEGVGTPSIDPPSGYSNYGSIGNYYISGSFTPAATPVVVVSLSQISVEEDGGDSLVFEVSRSIINDSPLTVNYTLSGTAQNGTDFSGFSSSQTQSVTIEANKGVGQIRIIPTADSLVEQNESVVITLSSGAGYTLGGANSVEGTILNDDTIVSLSVSPASKNEDNGSYTTYTFTRSPVNSLPLSVNFNMGGSATINDDYRLYNQNSAITTTLLPSISFPSNTATVTLKIQSIFDTTVEPDETVSITLATGAGYTIGTSQAVVATILNDDRPTVNLSLSPTSTVSEDGNVNFVFTFTLSAPTSNAVTVAYLVGGTATNGIDYTGLASASSTQTITIAANATSASVTIDPTADGAVENNETVILTLSTGTSYIVGATASVTGTITNDDVASTTAPSVTLALSPTSVSEDGATNLVYTFTRSAVSASALTVNYTVSGTAINGSDYTGLTAGSSQTATI
ncbi:MAG: hypothetical protein RIR26_2240, partial [Pseudomonadota bacterium]